MPVRSQTAVPYTGACQLQSPSMQMVLCAPHVVLQTCVAAVAVAVVRSDSSSSSDTSVRAECSKALCAVQLTAIRYTALSWAQEV
jgi:hypothetical protein